MASEGSERVFPRWLVALAAIVGVGLLLYGLRGVLTPVFFAFLIAYMLDPVIDRFEARNIPRGVGIGVMLTLVLGALAVFLLLAVPGIVSDLGAFARDLPAVLTRLRGQYEPLLAEYGIEVPTSLSGALEQFHVGEAQMRQALGSAGSVVKWFLGGTVNVVGALAGLLLVPVFAAYLLHDFDRITQGTAELVPARWRPFVVDIAHEVDAVLGEFIRGQLLVMLILALLYSVAYGLLGVRLAILIGVVAGFLSFIPYVGGAAALGLALLMCLLDWGGWSQLIGVVVAYAIIQTLEGFFITPRVVGDKVGLPAVWVLFALMVGGELFGFLGILLALPAAAVIKIFVVRGMSLYRASDFFLRAEEALPAAGGRAGVWSSLLRAEGLPDAAAVRARKTGAVAPAPAAAAEPVAPDPSSNGDDADP